MRCKKIKISIYIKNASKNMGATQCSVCQYERRLFVLLILVIFFFYNCPDFIIKRKTTVKIQINIITVMLISESFVLFLQFVFCITHGLATK
jgi:hypothetical protein